jgi:hypothetical protein
MRTNAFPPGTADASGVAIAERLGANNVATLDRRRGPAEHVDALTLCLEVRKRQRSSQLWSVTIGHCYRLEQFLPITSGCSRDDLIVQRSTDYSFPAGESTLIA